MNNGTGVNRRTKGNTLGYTDIDPGGEIVIVVVDATVVVDPPGML